MKNKDSNEDGGKDVNKSLNAKKEKAPEIVQIDTPCGDKVLREEAKLVSVEKISSLKIQNLLEDMKKALYGQSDGVALAAPQIDVSLQIFIIHPSAFDRYDDSEIKITGTDKYETVFINPEIIKISKDKKKMEEGCLSVRPWYGKVKRASRATVKALNEKGEEFTMEASGLVAQIFQHEIDHFYGVLFIDKAQNLRELDIEGYEHKD